MGCSKIKTLQDSKNAQPPEPPLTLARWQREAGLNFEKVVAPHIAKLLEVKPDTSFKKEYHGVDARFVTKDGARVIIEIKSTSTGRNVNSQLHHTNSGKQMSDGWLAARGENPADSYKIVMQGDFQNEVLRVYFMTDERGWSSDPVLEVPFSWIQR